MGHCIDAIIAKQPVNETEAKKLGLALIYEAEYVIVPLVEENIYHFQIENNIDSVDFGEEIRWDCTTVNIIAKLLGFEKYVIASLEHWHFLGSNYENEEKRTHEVDINTALLLLGVPKTNNSEFDYLNLDSYRNAEFYYMHSVVGGNDAPNIIKGTILYPNYGKEE